MKTNELQSVASCFIFSAGLSERRQQFISLLHSTLTVTDEHTCVYNGLAAALGTLAHLQTDSFLLNDKMSKLIILVPVTWQEIKGTWCRFL